LALDTELSIGYPCQTQIRRVREKLRVIEVVQAAKEGHIRVRAHLVS
jgi:hypothetical protein